ncbi:MAG: hypothetical protein J6M62_05955 [Selenomonadaceae bacterium]|nr:hypothetical protein [Selenomonadaceae bacterium]MBP3722562.1 hypothetical protein [Selenomonadaceae bacterium]
MITTSNYYIEAATARGFNLHSFIKTAMDEYIERHPIKDASIPLSDVLALCNIDESELNNTEGIEFE